MTDPIEKVIAVQGPVSDDPYSKHLIRLYRGDFKRLSDLYSKKKPNEVIRHLVRDHINAVEAQKPKGKRHA